MFAIALFLSAFCALAYDANAQAQISIARISAPKEALMMIPVTYAAPDEQPPVALVLRFAYQQTMLEAVEVVAAPVLEQSDKTFDYELRNGMIAVALFGGAAPVPEGTLLYLMMRVKPDATVGNALPILNSTTHGANSNAEYVTVQVTSGSVRVIDTPDKHSADTSADWEITLPELMRVVQLYNAREYHCDSEGQDGYEAGQGDQSCAPHSSDYTPADWQISFSELLRMIQLYNSPNRMYHADSTTEDGFAPGPFGYAP